MMDDSKGYGERTIEYEDLAYISFWYHREKENFKLSGERFIHFDYEWRKSMFFK